MLLKHIPDWKYVVAKKYKPWMMRFLGFMGIICSLAKQIQSCFDKSLQCHEMLVWMQIPRVCHLRHVVVFWVSFFSSKKAIRSCLMIFKCVLATWPRSLIVNISYSVQHRWSCELITMKTRNCLTFFGNALMREASIMWTFLKRTLNLQCLIKFYP